MSLLKKLFSRKQDKSILNSDGKNTLTIDLDETGDTSDEAIDALAKYSGFDIFKGEVKHAYTLKFIKNEKKCPRCKAETKQLFSNMVYTTGSQMRVSTSPAGYFCIECPTVVVDETIIEQSVQGKYFFEAVVGLDKKGQFIGFDTWNGGKSIYLLNEDGIAEGITNQKGKSQLKGYSSIQNNSKKTSTRKRFRRKK